MKISSGFAPCERAQVAALYWDAFGAKLGRVMWPQDKALAFITAVVDPRHAICARDDTGAILGVAGFKTMNGALVDGTLRDLARVYGVWGSLWRAAVLQMLQRDTDNQRFLMDGIFVAPAARGRGVGTALLDGVIAAAAAHGYARVRLDVVDVNPRARALYARHGFVATDTQQIGVLRHIFAFRSATTMVYDITRD